MGQLKRPTGVETDRSDRDAAYAADADPSEAAEVGHPGIDERLVFAP
jgi:hypothetical protein